MTRLNRALNGTVDRQKKVVSRHREDESIRPPLSIRTRYAGAGALVGEVSAEKGTIRVSHTSVFNNPSTDNTRTAVAQQAALFTGDLPDLEQPDDWWPDGGAGDSLILPKDFDPEEDAFPEMPEGYFYARLDRGSQPCGLFSWDSGLEDSYWSSFAFTKPSSASLVKCFVSDLGERGSTPATLELWFDQGVQYNTLPIGEVLRLLIVRSSFGATLTPVSVSASGSKVVVGLDRAIDLREEVYVQVKRGFLVDNTTSPLVAASGKGKRYEYVICFNRSHTESNISEGTGVILTSPTKIYDTNGNWMWVFDTSILGAAPAAPVYLVTVLGGNESVVPPDDTVVRGIKKPASKPIPLAVYDPSPATPAGLPWPDGIGYGNMVIAGSTQRVLLAYYDGAPTTLTGTVISGTPVAVSEKVLLTDGGDPAIEVEAWVVRHV